MFYAEDLEPDPVTVLIYNEPVPIKKFVRLLLTFEDKGGTCFKVEIDDIVV